jgi:hypothetical protein
MTQTQTQTQKHFILSYDMPGKKKEKGRYNQIDRTSKHIIVKWEDVSKIK